MFKLIIASLVAYLIGSLNGAILISRIYHLKDPRHIGSKNPGSTNMHRMHGNKYAALTLIFDATKGFLPLAVAHYLLFSNTIIFAMTLGLCIGHIFPIYYKFKGGKGVAVTGGMLIALSWPIATIAIITWLLTLALFKISSVSAFSAILSIWLYICFFLLNQPPIYALTIFLPTLLVIAAHHENISSLIQGRET